MSAEAKQAKGRGGRGKKRTQEDESESANGNGVEPVPTALVEASSAKREKLLVSGGSEVKSPAEYKYMYGHSNHFATEALPGALPVGQNTPQKCAYGLYAEQLSGTSFTTPRVFNQRTWFYRILPQCVHKPFKPIDNGLLTNDFSKAVITPNQLRWKPFPLPAANKKVDFIEGLATIGGSGAPDIKAGLAIHVWCANADMVDKSFMNADGDLLFVPQQGAINVQTECGWLYVKPGEIMVIQRGIKFRVELPDVKKAGDSSRGYIVECYTGHFRIPDLGPIGSNGLANPRDFETPVAAYEFKKTPYSLVTKYIGQLYEAEQPYSPFDVVAWHGNYAPYKYDLAKFCVINSVSFDHLDPSTFTVLTCPTAEPGVATCDFVIFPPRWCVQEHTFRPPYYHRNVMSEFMGNIYGHYEAKPEGFQPGGGSLHSCAIGHGPDANAYKAGSDLTKKQEPFYLKGALAFMFETTFMLKLTPWAMELGKIDQKYYTCWEGLAPEFDPADPTPK